MKIFKIISYIFLILFITTLLFIMLINFFDAKFNQSVSKASNNITSVKENNQIDYSCTENNQDNIKAIADQHNLDYYEGEIVTNEVASYFQDPRIPDDYQINESDLEEAYALGLDDKPVILYLKFDDQNKYDHVNEFFGYGELFVDYSKRADLDNLEIFIGNTYDNLTKFINQFLIQRCY